MPTIDSVKRLAALLEQFLEDMESQASGMRDVSVLLLGCELGR